MKVLVPLDGTKESEKVIDWIPSGLRLLEPESWSGGRGAPCNNPQVAKEVWGQVRKILYTGRPIRRYVYV